MCVCPLTEFLAELSEFAVEVNNKLTFETVHSKQWYYFAIPKISAFSTLRAAPLTFYTCDLLMGLQAQES